MFLRSAGTYLLQCMLSHSRTKQSFKLPLCEPTIMGVFFSFFRVKLFKTAEMVFRHLRNIEKRDY